MATEYLYYHPLQRQWIRSNPPTTSRDAAARMMLEAFPHYKGGHTAPVLTERGGVPIVDEHNSTVHFRIDHSGHLRQDLAMLARARIK